MKQRISVRALIKNDNKTLLLRRSSGRPSLLGYYELPGGKLEYREQPEDSLSRHVLLDTGLVLKTIQLADVMTYVDKDESDLQYVFILFNVSVERVDKVKLSSNYDKYRWSKMSEVQQYKLSESTEILLNITRSSALNEQFINDDKNTSNDGVTIYTDGGSRGNPGPSASSYIIFNNKGDHISEGGQYLGITTNNQAEYHGVRLGLEAAIRLGVKSITFKIDSLLVVNQLNSFYIIKNKELWPIHDRIKSLLKNFDKVVFVHVNREQNTLADGIVNKILDEQSKGDV